MSSCMLSADMIRKDYEMIESVNLETRQWAWSCRIYHYLR